MIDTGIFDHAEFAGRRSNVSTCTLSATGECSAGPEPWSDDHGHGTHCAGTVGGARVGVAKDVVFHAVKVLSATGSGTTSTVAAGAKWVLDAVQAHPSLRPAVVSMSLGGGASAVVDAAVDSLIAANIPVVIAAGNDARNACDVSPARVPRAITVAAADALLRVAPYSNFGSCVDVFAPGSGIYSSVNAANAYGSWSGTSMAAPHVAGVVASALAVTPCLSVAQVASLVTSTASPAVTGAIPPGTPNLFVDSKAALEAAAATTCF